MKVESVIERKQASTINALFLELEALEKLYQSQSGWRLEHASFTEQPYQYEATLTYSKTSGPTLEIHYVPDDFSLEAIEEALDQEYQEVTCIQTDQFQNKAKIIQYHVKFKK